MKITAQEVKHLTTYIFKISGIVLDKSKDYLLENRLKPLLSDYGCQTYQNLYSKSQLDKTGNLKRDIIDAISTNETFFFRDTKPFDLLRNKIIPELIDSRQAQGFSKIPLRIWSAACSTGQEVYTIGMTLHEMLPNINNFDISIIGTDISEKAVELASYGKYNRFEMQRGLPDAYRQKYFTKQGDYWRIKDKVRGLAQFKKMNLLRPFTEISNIDIVFCRNVAIYFSPADKTRLFNNIAKVLVDDGALIVGGSETLTNLSSSFQSQQYLRTIYYTHMTSNSSTVPQTPKVVPKLQVPAKKIVSKQVPRKAKLVSRTIQASVSSHPKTKLAQPLKRQITPAKKTSVLNKSLPQTNVNTGKKKSLLAELSDQKGKRNSTSHFVQKEAKIPKKSLLSVIAGNNKTKK